MGLGRYPRVRISKEIFTLRDRRVHRLPGPSQFARSETKPSLRDGLLPLLKSESGRARFVPPITVENKKFIAVDSLEFSFEVCVCEQTW